jgi:bis(5'-nucleosidyl)-tetraphosphatase
MKKEKSCGTIIIENNKVLLIQQTDNAWGFPKGHIENNETEQETAIRETKEETNLDVKIISNKKYIINYKINNEIDKEVVLFLAKKHQIK